jgi:hypothetical protein
MNQNEAEAAAAFGRAFGESAVQSAPQFTGPLTSALDAAVSQAQQSAAQIDSAGKNPVVVEVATDAVASAVKGIDSRSKEGVTEMFRIMRGDTGNVQERIASATERAADALEGQELDSPFAIEGA